MVLAVKKTRIEWKQRTGMRILLLYTTAPFESDPRPTRSTTETALAACGYDIQALAVHLANCKAPQAANMASSFGPQAILVEAIGDAFDHPCLVELTQIIRRIMPKTRIVCLSDAPSSRWREALISQPQIDYILRWEDTDSLLGLFEDLEAGQQTPQCSGIAYWYHGQPVLF